MQNTFVRIGDNVTVRRIVNGKFVAVQAVVDTGYNALGNETNTRGALIDHTMTIYVIADGRHHFGVAWFQVLDWTPSKRSFWQRIADRLAGRPKQSLLMANILN